MVETKVPHNLNTRATAVAAQAGGAIDADCTACCTMRLPRYSIFVRSFHPNKIFEETDHLLGMALGGPWSGDNRGFSLDEKATSRVMHHYWVDTAQMPLWFQTIKPIASSNLSHGKGYGLPIVSEYLASDYPQFGARLIDLVQTSPYGPLYDLSHPDMRINTSGFNLIARSVPEAKIVRSELLLDQPCRKSAIIVTHHFGVNLAVPMTNAMGMEFVPDLDVFAKIIFDVNRTARTLDIETTVFGDGFPNCEVFLKDEADTRVFLGVSTRVGYPISNTFGSTLTGVQTNFMFASRLKFALDESGALIRFASGLAIGDWNARFIAFDPNATNNPTTFVQR